MYLLFLFFCCYSSRIVLYFRNSEVVKSRMYLMLTFFNLLNFMSRKDEYKENRLSFI